MSLKKIKIIGVVVIFLLTVLFHFLYDIFPNVVFSIFFPVNESIWEHMKLLYSGILVWGIIEYFILKSKNIKFNNFGYQLFLTAFSSILIYLIIFLPIYNLIGENMVVSIGILILVIILEQIFSYYLLKDKNDKDILDKISIVLIILFYVVFAFLTYNPIKNYIFYDTQDHVYGIPINKA